MGKSSLIDRYAQICEKNGDGQFLVLKIDWEEYSNLHFDSSIDIMDIIANEIGKHPKYKEEFGQELNAYKQFREQTRHILKKIADAEEEVRSMSMSFADHSSIESHEFQGDPSLVAATVEAGSKAFKKETDQHDRWLHSRLSSDEVKIYKNLQRETSIMCVRMLESIAVKTPMLLLSDTCEHIERFNGWLRDGLIFHGSDRIIYVVAGRNDHSDFFRDRLPEEIIREIKLKSFSVLDTEDYLRARGINVAGTDIVDTVHRISRGVPLAVKVMAKALSEQQDISRVFGGVADIPIIAKDQIVREVTRRFLRYCMGSEHDDNKVRVTKAQARSHIYTLALMRQHTNRTYRDQILKAVWGERQRVITGSDIDDILLSLADRYSFIFGSSADIHPTVKDFILMALRDQSVPRGDTDEINKRIYDFVNMKLNNFHGEPEELYGGRDYQEYCLDKLNHLLWIDEREAIRFLVDTYIKAMVVNKEFGNALMGILSEDVREHLTDDHQQVIWALQNVSSWTGGSQEQLSMAFRVEQMLLDWLSREGKVRVHLLQAKDLSRKGRKGIRRAVSALERADELCEKHGDMKQIRAEAAVRVATALADIGKSKEATALVQRVLALEPANIQANLLLGRLLYGNGDFAGAVEVYETAMRNGSKNPTLQRELTRARQLLSVRKLNANVNSLFANGASSL